MGQFLVAGIGPPLVTEPLPLVDDDRDSDVGTGDVVDEAEAAAVLGVELDRGVETRIR